MEKLSDLFSFVSSFRPFRKHLGYFGWTGMGNLGDEVLLDAIVELLHPINVLKHLRYSGRGKFIQNYLENHLFSGMLLGAGTLINSSGYLKNMTLMQQKGLRTFILGTGVLDPAFHSQFPNWPNCMPAWVEVLNKCEHVSVRGPLSQNILKEYGYKNAKICGDPALFYASDKITTRPNKKVIGINIGTTLNGVSLWGYSDEKVLKFAISLCRALNSRGYKLILFPVWVKDIGICKELAKSLNHEIPIISSFHDRKYYMSCMNNVDYFIGEKLHSVILALCTYTPSIMLSYTPKGEDFMASIDCLEYSIRTDLLNIEHVLDLLKIIESRYESYQAKIYEKCSYYKNKLKECAGEIINLL